MIMATFYETPAADNQDTATAHGAATTATQRQWTRCSFEPHRQTVVVPLVKAMRNSANFEAYLESSAHVQAPIEVVYKNPRTVPALVALNIRNDTINVDLLHVSRILGDIPPPGHRLNRLADLDRGKKIQGMVQFRAERLGGVDGLVKYHLRGWHVDDTNLVLWRVQRSVPIWDVDEEDDFPHTANSER